MGLFTGVNEQEASTVKPVFRPVESHSGARENIIAGPYHPLLAHSVCLEIEMPKASRGRKRRERCPLTIRLGVRGSVVSSPSGVRGRAPAENGFYAYFRSEKRHLEHHFQYFWATAGPPKRRWARENFPPLDGPASVVFTLTATIKSPYESN